MPDEKRFLLRLSKTLWNDLQRSAAEDLRSVNGQIEFLLREALNRRKTKNKSAPKESNE
jgi:hypothetical protein